MKKLILSIALIFSLLIPSMAMAVSQETVDQYEFLLRQPEWDSWGDGVFDDTSLFEGLNAVHSNAISSNDDILLSSVIWAMGETGLAGFVPNIIEYLETDPAIACFALGKITSNEAVEALIPMLTDEDMHVRSAAAWGLGNMVYIFGMEDVREDAIDALAAQLAEETEDWVADDIDAALTLVETGIIDSVIFMDFEGH